MNNGNLKPFTAENAKEYGRKGGIESGKSKLRTKTLKEQMKLLLTLPAIDNQKVEELTLLGFDKTDITNKFLLTYALFEKALSGDVKAYILIDKLVSSDDKEKANEFFGSLFE